MSDQPMAIPGVVIILGMHRSGTSCLAASLEEAGLYFGKVNRESLHNPKGNLEPKAVRELNDEILGVSGGEWHSPPASIIWRAEQRAKRDLIVGRYPTSEVWGFKDPRTLLTFEGWIEVLPGVQCVGTFRHPLAVARSLHTRDGFSLEKSFRLWEYYNKRLLHFQRQMGFDLLCFDLPVKTYVEKLNRIVLKLDLKPPGLGYTFFEPGLRSTIEMDDERLPEPIDTVYQSLLAQAL